MSAHKPFHIPTNNQILAALSRQEYRHLFENLELTQFPRGRIVYDVSETVHHAYFIMGGIASLLSVTKEGFTTQVAMVSSEGLLGVPAILGVSKAPYRVTAQLPVSAMRIKSAMLKREFARGGPLQDILLRYVHALITQISQSASCNRFHTLEERLCRWLLIGHDRVKADVIHLTQEALSQMVGAHRTGVTMVASNLQKKGLIRYQRGKIRIMDRRGLEVTACECYGVVTSAISGMNLSGNLRYSKR